MQLIYLCHPIARPVGGVKVIYKQAGLANELLRQKGHEAFVMHPNTWRFKVRWFENSTAVLRGFFGLQWLDGKPSFSDTRNFFKTSQHRVVIPELWARKYGWQLARANIPYAIFVQNGYFINKGNSARLDEAYAGARCILTISDDTSRCVSLAFPGSEPRIQRMHYSVDSKKFSPTSTKENIITYMPRKLAEHSSKVIFFLRHNLPKHWKIIPIDGLDENGVTSLLQRSKIFMSFSHFEGCPLPPLEAALCGNQVIGYTGQGAKEYWNPSIFEQIEAGDVATFAERVLAKTREIDSQNNFQIHSKEINQLTTKFSARQEQIDLELFLSRLMP